MLNQTNEVISRLILPPPPPFFWLNCALIQPAFSSSLENPLKTTHHKCSRGQWGKIEADIQYWAVKPSFSQITVPAWAKTIHYEQALAQNCSQTGSEQLFMMENSMRDWGIIVKHLVLSPGTHVPLRRQKYVGLTKFWIVPASYKSIFLLK